MAAMVVCVVARLTELPPARGGQTRRTFPSSPAFREWLSSVR